MKVVRIGYWEITGQGVDTKMYADDIADVDVWEDAMAIDCHDGIHLPDAVTAEWLRRRGWTVSHPKEEEMRARLDEEASE